MKQKRIALQEGLHQLAAQLKEEGYQIVSVDDGGEPLDVIIYSNKNKKYLAHNLTGAITSSANNQFVTMINADEYSYEELLRQIESIH
ncbi:YkuS family protein [Alkaliphilus crotonatoxidans]